MRSTASLWSIVAGLFCTLALGCGGGSDTLDGADGPRMLDGADGPRMLDGADGPRTPDGADGLNAPDGADGPTLPECTSTMNGSPALTPETFCQIFIAVCGTTHVGYGSMSECIATYSAARLGLQMCQSWHLCQAEEMTGTKREAHCPHAAADPNNGVCF